MFILHSFDIHSSYFKFPEYLGTTYFCLIKQLHNYHFIIILDSCSFTCETLVSVDVLDIDLKTPLTSVNELVEVRHWEQK